MQRLDGDHSHTLALLQAMLAEPPNLKSKGKPAGPFRTMHEELADKEPGSHVFRSTDLPPELRDMIFALCLARGKVFLRPRPKHDRRYNGHKAFPKPELQSLTVSRRVRAEAAAVFFQQNHFVFSYEFDTWAELMHPANDEFPIALSAYAPIHLTSISITLELRNLCEDALDLADWARDDRAITRTPGAATLGAHGMSHGLYTHWQNMCDGAVGLSKLRFLQVNLANCLCPDGYHRLIIQVADAIRALPTCPSLELIEVLGTKSDQERRSLIDELVDCSDCSGSVDEEYLADTGKPIVRFRGDPPTANRFNKKETVEKLEDEEVDLGALIAARRRTISEAVAL